MKDIYIDVRSEEEYQKGHMVGAVNMPILNDMERREVGFLYKQVSTDEARIKGTEFGSQKLTEFVKNITAISGNKAPTGNLYIYCARGGYRSSGLVKFLQGLGLDVKKYKGGYKAYRRMVLEKLSNGRIPTLIAVNGLTGSGKTRVLKHLKEMSQPIIDLEGAANHKGSTLGAIGTDETQSPQNFENTIVHSIMDAEKMGKNYAFIEMESRKIGRLTVPNRIFDAYHSSSSNIINIVVPTEIRIKNILEDYAGAKNFESQLSQAMDRLKRYIPRDVHEDIQNKIKAGDLAGVTRLLLVHHYDPLYNRSVQERSPLAVFTGEDSKLIANQIAAWISDFKKTISG